MRSAGPVALLPSYEVARRELTARGTNLGFKFVHRLARTLGAQVLAARTRLLLRWRAGQLRAGHELAGTRVPSKLVWAREPPDMLAELKAAEAIQPSKTKVPEKKAESAPTP